MDRGRGDCQTVPNPLERIGNGGSRRRERGIGGRRFLCRRRFADQRRNGSCRRRRNGRRFDGRLGSLSGACLMPDMVALGAAHVSPAWRKFGLLDLKPAGALGAGDRHERGGLGRFGCRRRLVPTLAAFGAAHGSTCRRKIGISDLVSRGAVGTGDDHAVCSWRKQSAGSRRWPGPKLSLQHGETIGLADFKLMVSDAKGRGDRSDPCKQNDASPDIMMDVQARP